mmetsp:Transcript_10667/g.16895  ORF Transcript_10667/g.16895 Transcript_10667/m.16895 type:complete len:228 (+) Transcript_10667:280-963(+)
MSFSWPCASCSSEGWSPSTLSMSRMSFASHCANTSTTVESVMTTASCSTVMGSNLSARCSTPDLTLMRIFAILSYFCLLRSHLLVASDRWLSNSSTILRDPKDPVPLYLISSTLALACAFSSLSASMRACASLVMTTRLLCVSSCVKNFWITSFTSDTPVASLILRNASSYVVIFFCSSSMTCSLSAEWKAVLNMVFFRLASPASPPCSPPSTIAISRRILSRFSMR